ncbi:MAG: hypothetical protein AAGA08_17380 [Pseudomonadota bacterium]
MSDPASAVAIIDVMLHRTAQAILLDDFAAMSACFHLPFVLETDGLKLIIDSEEKHRALFERLVEGYKSKNVTDIIRECEAAEFVSPNVIRSLHISHVMAGSHRVEEPISTLATTELYDDGWRITSAQYLADSEAAIKKAILLQSRQDPP